MAVNESPLARLYEEHFGRAYRLAYVLTGEPDVAEDLVQDAFVRVIGRYAHLRRPDAFEAYLRRTIVNLTYGTFRRRRLERAYLAREGRLAGAPGQDPPDVGSRDEMWDHLQRIAPRQRAALVLRYYEDLSDEQTAQVLRCSVRTVKSLVARGKDALRAQSWEGAPR